MNWKRSLVWGAAVLFGLLPLVWAAAAPPPVSQGGTGAAVVALSPSKDNTLYEDSTGNLSNGAGDYFFAGRIAGQGNFELRRGLIAFDVAAAIPANALIFSATLSLNMSKTVAGPYDVSLHRATADWGEGLSDAPGEEGIGTQALAGDATWLHTFFDSSLWATAGGDYATTASATTTVSGTGRYLWGSSQGMVADIQRWLQQPGSNFGWVIIGDENAGATTHTAKRFDSGDHFNPASRPVLVVGYLADPERIFLPVVQRD